MTTSTVTARRKGYPEHYVEGMKNQLVGKILKLMCIVRVYCERFSIIMELTYGTFWLSCGSQMFSNNLIETSL